MFECDLYTSNRDVGAISTQSAADHYGLHVLERGIGRSTNVFRFILLGREPLVTSALPLCRFLLLMLLLAHVTTSVGYCGAHFQSKRHCRMKRNALSAMPEVDADWLSFARE